jgi:hypothetical protein
MEREAHLAEAEECLVILILYPPWIRPNPNLRNRCLAHLQGDSRPKAGRDMFLRPCTSAEDYRLVWLAL